MTLLSIVTSLLLDAESSITGNAPSSTVEQTDWLLFCTVPELFVAFWFRLWECANLALQQENISACTVSKSRRLSGGAGKRLLGQPVN